MLIQFRSFVVVGALATGLHYLIYLALLYSLPLSATVATSIGYVGGAIVNYILNRKYTFKATTDHLGGVTRFFTVALVGFTLNGLLVRLLVDTLLFHPLLGQMAASVIVLVWNFLANRFWTFKKR